MKKEKIRELRELINKAYDMSNDSRISLYIRVIFPSFDLHVNLSEVIVVII